MRDNVEALARMFDNLRFSLLRNDGAVVELLDIDPNDMAVMADDNFGEELVTPNGKAKRKLHISVRRRRHFWCTAKRARTRKVRAQTPHTPSSKLDSFSDFELSQSTLSEVAQTPLKRARQVECNVTGHAGSANCSGAAAAMNMVEVEDIEDAEATPAPRADSVPPTQASRAEEVEGAKDIEDIEYIKTVEDIEAVEHSGAATGVADVPLPVEPTGADHADSAAQVSVGTGSFDVEYEGQRDLERCLADIEVAEYDIMSGVAWIMFEGEKVCAKALRAAEGEGDMTWASFILDTSMGKWELELEVRDLKWTSVNNKVLPPQDREMAGRDWEMPNGWSVQVHVGGCRGTSS